MPIAVKVKARASIIILGLNSIIDIVVPTHIELNIIYLAVLAILFPWFLTQATTYMSTIFNNFPQYIGG